MNRYQRSFVLVAMLVLAGCAADARQASHATVATAPSAKHRADAWLANGSAIYHTGRDFRGIRIAAKQPPLMPSCEACHGATGAGGLHLPGGAVSADLRYRTLVSSQKHPYTQTLLERAIARGIDDDGDTLASVMPRWKLSARDLHDVAYYVLHKLK